MDNHPDLDQISVVRRKYLARVVEPTSVTTKPAPDESSNDSFGTPGM